MGAIVDAVTSVLDAVGIVEKPAPQQTQKQATAGSVQAPDQQAQPGTGQTVGGEKTAYGSDAAPGARGMRSEGGSPSDTLLTGPGGVETGKMSLGRSTLLGG
jgi:hypothetical protein